MKPIKVFYVFFSLILAHGAMAQAPQGINYQGVARSADGQPLASKEISIRIGILDGSANGAVEYEEIHEVKTNPFGLFTLVIGQGEPGSGLFQYVNWTSGKKWLQVGMDEYGGRNFILMGSQQLMSVPYALYAERAGNGYQAGQGIAINNNMITNLGDGDKDVTNELITGMSFGPDNKLRITDAGGTREADLSGLVGASQDLGNVLLQGNDAGASTIANLGAPVNASDAATKLYVDGLDASDGDKSATNEIQVLGKTGNSISLSAGGGSVTLNDDSPTNELQTLSTQSVDADTRALSLSNGNTINVDVRDADASAVNEAQTLTKTGATVSLTPVGGAGGGSFVINDDSNTNEAQSISRTGANVTLAPANGAGGGTFSINDADADPSNELQNLSQVLSRGSDAGGSRIANLADPTSGQEAATKNYVDTQDAILSAKISTTYAFKATFDYENLSGGVLNDQAMPFVSEDFDDFNVLGPVSFVAAEDGTYVFVVEGYYNTLTAGGSLSLFYNSVKFPITIVMPFTTIQPRFSGTFMFKLTAGQSVSLVGDNIPASARFNGKFFGFKL